MSMRNTTLSGDKPVIAIGDIHGEATLLETILWDLEQRGSETNGVRIVTLGDYSDRGNESRQVLERLIQGPSIAGNEYVHILGNHDMMMLEAYRYPKEIPAQRWFMVGGIQTLISYGLNDEDDLYDGNWRKLIPEEHIDFLSRMPLIVETEEHILVHAGLRPGVSLKEQNAHDLTWIRQEFLDSEYDFGRLVIHGHTITRQPALRVNRIGIDTGAHQNGILTAVLLNETPEFIQAVQQKDELEPRIREWTYELITNPVPG